MQSSDFALNPHLMQNILGITYELLKALQCKEQDSVNAINLVKIPKEWLQMMRDNGWDSLLDEVASFRAKYEIIVPNMNDKFVARGRPPRRAEEITNLHDYCVELFYTTIDIQLQE